MAEKFRRKTLPDDKARNWTFIVYPESAPVDWVDRIASTLIPVVISPKHSADEDHSKPHYHVMFSFASPASAKKIMQILYSYEIEKGVGGYTPTKENYNMIQVVNEFRPMCRYFCHLDQPDKEQLFWSDMTALNGLDIDCVLVPGFSQQLDYCNDIIDYIEREGIYYFYDLVNYAKMYYFDSWFVYLKEHSNFIKEYLRSKGAKRDYQQKKEMLQSQQQENHLKEMELKKNKN